MHIHVINLVRSTDRRAFMQAQLDPLGLPYSFFDASDARAPEFAQRNRYNEAAALQRTGQTLSLGECGCFSSHHRLWQHCVDTQQPLVVMEDDVVVCDSLVDALQDVARHIEQRRFIRLCGLWDCRYDPVQPLSGPRRVVRYRKGPMGAQCYALSPAGAQALLQHANTWVEPVDRYIDRFWRHGVHSYALHPFPVGLPPEDLTSEIGGSRAATRNKAALRRHRWAGRIGRLRANLAFWLWGDPPLSR